jgi:hypothetical protein
MNSNRASAVDWARTVNNQPLLNTRLVENVLTAKHDYFVIPAEINAADNTLVCSEGLLIFYFFYHNLLRVRRQVINFSLSGQPGCSWA